MTSSRVFNYCDYVTLFFTEETASDNKQYYEFDIPNYCLQASRSRGPMCTIQVASGSCNYDQEDKHNTIAFQLVSGSVNGFTVTDGVQIIEDAAHDFGDDLAPISGPTIAICQEDTEIGGGELHNTGEYLISGGIPHKLRIKITSVADKYTEEIHGADKHFYDVVVPAPQDLVATMVLKFTYYDAVASAVNMHDHQNYRFI
jgi:hypothetical protein